MSKRARRDPKPAPPAKRAPSPRAPAPPAAPSDAAATSAPAKPAKSPRVALLVIAAAAIASVVTAAVMNGGSEPASPGAAAPRATGGPKSSNAPCPPGMSRVPAGTYMMGVSEAEGGAPDEGPPRRVEVDSFCLDLTEVTVESFAACVKAGKCSDEHLSEWSADGENFAPNRGCNWNVDGRLRHPINCVDSRDAAGYCAWKGGRLPTEPEWEWAARGGDEARKYPWGDAPPTNQLCWRGEGDVEGKGKRTATCEVGSLPAGDGRFGHHDLAGNLWEWTASHYCPYSTGEPCGEDALVSRGASLVNDSDWGVRVARRSRELPTHRLFYLGFRCAHD